MPTDAPPRPNHPRMPRAPFRALLAAIALLSVTEAAYAVSGPRPLSRLPARATRPAPALRIPTDTVVPPLSRAELRELRRLEREDARYRRRRGESRARTATPAARGHGENGLAVASLSAGSVAVLAVLLLFILQPWDVGAFVVISAVSAVCAVIFGAIGLRRAKREGRRRKGLAIGGLVIGITVSAFWAFLLGLLIAWIV